MSISSKTEKSPVVEDICMAFGGMGPTTIMANKTMTVLKGNLAIVNY